MQSISSRCFGRWEGLDCNLESACLLKVTLYCGIAAVWVALPEHSPALRLALATAAWQVALVSALQTLTAAGTADSALPPVQVLAAIT